VTAAASGSAFALAAVAARVLAGDPAGRVVEQPGVAVVLVVATAAGQVLLTRALATGTPVAVLALMYGAATLVATTVGVLSLADPWPASAAGRVVAAAGIAAAVAGVAVVLSGIEGSGEGREAAGAGRVLDAAGEFDGGDRVVR
jgi:hypothetical protein